MLGRQRLGAGRPQGGGGLDADGIGKADLGDAVAKVGVVAVACVGQYNFGFDPGGAGGAELVQRDLGLGLEDDIIRHACLSSPVRVIGPLMRQIQAIGDGQAGVIIGGRQAHGNLAVVLFAELPAVLPRHADRVPAFLRHAGVVDDQRADRATLLDDGQDARAHRRQHGVVRPIGFCHEVMERLMRRPHPRRLHARGHRLDTFAVAGQQQTRAI